MNAAAIEMSAPRIPALTPVQAGLLYLEPTAEKPRSLEYEPPPGVPQTNAVYRERQVTIRDVRPIATTLSLERQGFQLLRAPTRLENFDTEAAITTQYYEEAIALLREVTGASRVVVFDHTIRRRIPGASDRRAGVPRQPVPRVHVDYTVKSGPQRLRDVLPQEAPELLKRRFAVINLWRPIQGPIQDSPLAVSDARSVANEDLIATDLVYPNRMGEIYYVKFNPAHEWFYAPAMRADEVMLLKCYDSLDDGRARFVPHSSFVDPTTPANAPPRQSIELRTLVLF